MFKAKLWIICLLSYVLANQAFASNYYVTKKPNYSYYWGIGYQSIFAKGKGDWSKVFESHHPGANIYFGMKLGRQQNFGLELGYSSTTRKSSHYDATNGQTVFGVDPGANVRATGQIRLKNTYLDGNYFFNQCNLPFIPFVQIGIGFSRQSVDLNTDNSASPLHTALYGVAGKTTATLRLGAGLDYNIKKNWGVRAALRYETLRNVKLRNVPATNTAGAKALRNSTTINLGCFWNIA